MQYMSMDDFFSNFAKGVLENFMDNLEKSIEMYYKVLKDGEAIIDGKKEFAYAYVFGYLENSLETLI